MADESDPGKASTSSGDDAAETVDAAGGGRSWSPARVVAGVVGLVLAAVGGAGLARLGFFGSIIGDTTSVLGFSTTRLGAIVAVVTGIVLVGMVATPSGVKGGLMTLGVLAAVYGVFVAVDPEALAEALGTNLTTGILWLLAGLVMAVSALVSPTIDRRRRGGGPGRAD